MSNDLKARLKQGLSELELLLTDDQQQQLLDYLQLLNKWNRHFNLSAIRDINDMLALHLLDSLSVLPYLSGDRILDVGTGAGLPGFVIAIAFPEKSVTLLDSNGKKTRFCRQVNMELGLENVAVEQNRIENFISDSAFDSITSRAFAALPKMVELMEPLLGLDTRLIAMKGQTPFEEIKSLENKGFQVQVNHLQVPFIEGQRRILLIER